jgi:hypothetical protein
MRGQNRLLKAACQPIHCRKCVSAGEHPSGSQRSGADLPAQNPQPRISDGFLLFQAGHLALQMPLKPREAFESHTEEQDEMFALLMLYLMTTETKSTKLEPVYHHICDY